MQCNAIQYDKYNTTQQYNIVCLLSSTLKPILIITLPGVQLYTVVSKEYLICGQIISHTEKLPSILSDILSGICIQIR